MRELLERHRSVQFAVVIAAASCVLALVQAASAHNDLDMREVFRPSAPESAPAHVAETPPAGGGSLRSAARPLRITLDNTRHDRRRTADRRKPGARQKPAPDTRLAVLPPPRDGLFDPLPQKPAIISVYEDRTLRRGDAVMMFDGLRVFVGREDSSHRPIDFVLLHRATTLDGHLRRTLGAFEQNPPDHWRS